jgi:hypothetical protein
MYSWCAQNFQTPIETALDKHIARKQREREALGPVFPPMGDIIKGKKDLEPLHGENSGD